MTGYVLSPGAKADLVSIWRYSASQWSVAQADRYLADINAACSALAAGRKTGRSLEDVRAGYRRLSVGSHFIVYRLIGDTIDVIRVLHQRMDIRANLEN